MPALWRAGGLARRVAIPDRSPFAYQADAEARVPPVRHSPFVVHFPRPKSAIGIRAANSRGFTIIELVSVLAIIVVMLSIALGSYSGWARASSIDVAANLTATILGHARELAITRQVDTQVLCSNITVTGRAPCGIISVMAPGDDTNATVVLVMPANALPSGIGFGFLLAAGQSLVFHPDGTCSASTPVNNCANFVVCETMGNTARALQPRVVEVNQFSGRIRVHRENEP